MKSLTRVGFQSPLASNTTSFRQCWLWAAHSEEWIGKGRERTQGTFEKALQAVWLREDGSWPTVTGWKWRHIHRFKRYLVFSRIK